MQTPYELEIAMGLGAPFLNAVLRNLHLLQQPYCGPSVSHVLPVVFPVLAPASGQTSPTRKSIYKDSYPQFTGLT